MRLPIKILVTLTLLSSQLAVAYEIGDFDVHGTLSQGWIHSEDNNFIADSTDGTFDFREFGLNATTSIGERASLGGQIFARKYGAIGDDDIYLDWLSLTYSVSDELGVRAGKLKMPYGLYGETRDIDSLRTQILLPQGVYVEAYRGSVNAMWGGAVFGTVSSDDWGSLQYSAQLGQSNVDEDSGELNRLASYVDLAIDSADDGQAGAIKLLWDAPTPGLRLGSTFSWSEFSATGPTDSFLGIPGSFEADLKEQYFLVSSAEYTLDRTTLSFEHLYSNIEAELALGTSALPAIDFEVNMSGYYLNLDYRATERLTLALGHSALSVKQTSFDLAPGSGGKDKQNGFYASLRYDITYNFVAKLEQHFSTGQASLFVTENPDGLEDDWSMTLFKLSFVF